MRTLRTNRLRSVLATFGLPAVLVRRLHAAEDVARPANIRSAFGTAYSSPTSFFSSISVLFWPVIVVLLRCKVESKVADPTRVPDRQHHHASTTASAFGFTDDFAIAVSLSSVAYSSSSVSWRIETISGRSSCSAHAISVP